MATKLTRRKFVPLFIFALLLSGCAGPAVIQTPMPGSPISSTPAATTPILPTNTERPSGMSPIATDVQVTLPPLPTPSGTPTSLPSSSNTPRPTAPFTLIPTPDPEALNTQGLILIWDGSVYGFLDPSAYLEDPGFVFAEPSEADPSYQADALAFSQASYQLAYVIYEDHASLWIASLDLQKAHELWLDESDWLTYFSEGSGGYVTWGPRDHFIIVYRKSIGVVFDLSTGVPTQVAGLCNHIALSPASGLLAAWCPTSEDSQNDILVLEQDGTSFHASSIPENSVQVQDWVFSPTSNRVLYADNDGALFIWDGDNGKSINLNSHYGLVGLADGKTLKWSLDGTLVITFGYHEGGFCPETSSGNEHACWSITNAETGEALWWTGNGSLPIDIARSLSDGLEASLSPDNRWVLVSRYGEFLSPLTVIISVETGEVQTISATLYATAFWSR